MFSLRMDPYRYYLSRHCAVCDGLTSATRTLCDACIADPATSAAVLAARAAKLERQHVHIARICGACGGGGGVDTSLPGSSALVPCGGIVCDSIECGLYFERRKVAQELASSLALQESGIRLLGGNRP